MCVCFLLFADLIFNAVHVSDILILNMLIVLLSWNLHLLARRQLLSYKLILKVLCNDRCIVVLLLNFMHLIQLQMDYLLIMFYLSQEVLLAFLHCTKCHKAAIAISRALL